MHCFLEGVDDFGLDPLDRSYMRVLAETYEGGPAGIEAIAATLGEDSGTLEDLCRTLPVASGPACQNPPGSDN